MDQELYTELLAGSRGTLLHMQQREDAAGAGHSMLRAHCTHQMAARFCAK